MKDLRPAAVRANVTVPEDLRLTNPIERQAEVYADPPTLLPADILAIKATRKLPAVAPTPAHFWRPRTESGVSESYPPVAVMTEAQAELKLGGSTKSPWGWVAGAVLARCSSSAHRSAPLRRSTARRRPRSLRPQPSKSRRSPSPGTPRS